MNMQPKIFISYAWVNESHKKWVQNLADELVKFNMNVIFDRELLPGQEITKFMEVGVKKADVVLLICSKVFTKKANNREMKSAYDTNQPSWFSCSSYLLFLAIFAFPKTQFR